MHVSAIDLPSDPMGSVSDVARPLLHKLNQATMQRSTYDSLRTLLVWAVALLDEGIEDALETHQAMELAQHSRDFLPLVKEIVLPEIKPDGRIFNGAGHNVAAQVKPATEPENAPAEVSEVSNASTTPNPNARVPEVVITEASLPSDAEAEALQKLIDAPAEVVAPVEVTKTVKVAKPT